MLPLPLTTLIRQLRAAGFPLDPGREMQLRRVVHERGAEYVGRFGEMKYLLAPFVASRPEEQRNFYAFWDRYVADLEREWAGEDDSNMASDVSAPAGWRWLLLPLLAVLAYGAYRYVNPNPPPLRGERYDIKIGLPGAAPDSIYEEYIRLTEGDTLRLLNKTRGRLLGADSSGFRWRVEDLETASVLFASRAEYSSDNFHLEMARPLVQGESLRAILAGDHLGLKAGKSADTLLFIVQCASPPAKPEIKVADGIIEVNAMHAFAVLNPEQGVVYNWDIGQQGLQGASVETDFSREGRYNVSVRAIRDGLENIDLCYSLSTTEVQVVEKGHDLPLLASVPLVKDVRRTFANRSSGYKWGKWLLIGLILGPLLWWKHRRETETRREKTDEEIAEAYPIFDQGPYNVPYRSRNDQISVPADFYRIADQLRVREEAEARVFDGAATIEATVNSGGFPTWRERSLHRPADYLVLVTHNDEFNQQDLLLRRLTDFLSAREAAITVYYHEGQFEHFWNKDYPKGWSPDRLYDRYQQFRLLILGNAHGLVDNYASHEPRLRPDKAKWLNGWARRLVLTTEPSADWTAQEVLLHRHALLYPITLRGLNEGIRMLNETEEYEPHDFVKWRALHQRTNPEPSARYRKWETVSDHEDYLSHDPELMRWLRGLAVSGNPDWNLTIAIGRALDIEVTHDRLLQLSRIPWLAGNRPDHDLRFALLERSSSTDEAAARGAVIKELELVEDSVKGSFAQTEWQTNLAVHQLYLAPASAPQKASLREMIRAGLFTSDQLRELELAAERKERPADYGMTKGSPPPPAPGSLDRLLAKDERDWWDTEPGRRFIGTLVLATGLVLFVLSQLTPERELAEGKTAPWWADVSVVDDAALEANNEAVTLWENTDASIREEEGAVSIPNATAFGNIKSKLKEAWDLREGGYPQAAANRWKTSLNQEGYRLNAAYLDLAADKEVAFRDLLEEEETIAWAGTMPDELSPTLEHQHGLALLGLYLTLNEKYPLGEFPPTGRNQLEKQFPDISWQSSALTGLISAEGKLPDGQEVSDLRTERDSLFADAEGTLRLIEQVTNGLYFDSLTLVMPVNLRTMVAEIEEGAAVQDTTEPPAPVESPQDEELEPQPVSVPDPNQGTDEQEDNTNEKLTRILKRYETYRYNQGLTFGSNRVQDQLARLEEFNNLIRYYIDKAGYMVIDENILSSGLGGRIFGGLGGRLFSGEGNEQGGLILLADPEADSSYLSYPNLERLDKYTYVLIVVSTYNFDPSQQVNGGNLKASAERLKKYFSSLGAEVMMLSDPTQAELMDGVNGIDPSLFSQAIVILNLQQSTGSGSILLGGKDDPVEEFSVAAISEMQAAIEKMDHALLVTNMLNIGDVSAVGTEPSRRLIEMTSSELLTLIQKSGDRSAANYAQAIVRQADVVVNQNNGLISDMARRSGGRNGNDELLYPDNTSAVEFNFLKGSSGYAVETQVGELADLLKVYYRSLKVPDATRRISLLRRRFNTQAVGKLTWSEATFTNLTVAEAIPVLGEINKDTRTAERAYLLALAESLNLAAGE